MLTKGELNLTPAVLFIVFNRPAPTAQVFSAIRNARPSRLYIAADGPRKDCREDADACRRVREIVSEVDWPCDVKFVFNSDNLGCTRAVVAAISWFFDHEQEGIILEDDCLPHSSFFSYCRELLERYRNNEKVMAISGDNSIASQISPPFSYAFTNFALVWGWASWARAWKHFDFSLPCRAQRSKVIRHVCQTNENFEIINKTLEKIRFGEIDTWDYIWNFNIWDQQGLCLIPKENLVSNIGFGEGASHTTDATDSRANRPVRRLNFPLIHPHPDINPEFEKEILDKVFIPGI